MKFLNKRIKGLSAALFISGATLLATEKESNILSVLDEKEVLLNVFAESHIVLEGSFTEQNGEGGEKDRINTSLNFKLTMEPKWNGKFYLEASPYRISNPEYTSYTDQNMRFYYDGVKWFTFIDSHIVDGIKKPINHCIITPEKPTFLGDAVEGYMTGHSFFPQTLPVIEGVTLRDALTDRSLWFGDVTHYDRGSRKTIRLDNKCAIYALTIDSAKNNSIVEYTQTLGICSNKALEIVYTYGGDMLNVQGVNSYIPSELTRQYIRKGVAINTSRTIINKLSLIPASDANYVPTIEKGWSVLDKIQNISYKSGSDHVKLLPGQ